MRRVLRRELADAEVIDTLMVIWMEGEVTVLKDVTVDRSILVDPDPDDCQPPEICLEDLDEDDFVSRSNLILPAQCWVSEISLFRPDGR